MKTPLFQALFRTEIISSAKRRNLRRACRSSQHCFQDMVRGLGERGKVHNIQLVLVGRVVGEERKGFLLTPMSFAKQ